MAEDVVVWQASLLFTVSPRLLPIEFGVRSAWPSMADVLSVASTNSNKWHSLDAFCVDGDMVQIRLTSTSLA